MPTRVKIKIFDNNKLRQEIDELYEKTNQIDLAKWSLLIAKHILDIVNIDYHLIDEIIDGFKVNELWQIGEARMYDVRQAGFKIHKIARESNSEIKKTALRVAGQAVGSGHMGEHAMVASDYAIKTIGLITSNDFKAVTLEREWQLKELRKIVNGKINLDDMP
ncbi:putative immunity protein [Sporosalibacterium faouarense]|uniref:putative immunity protein n=1 Tax=Sporosalibacterium faouarense TaxID=516123 RepID=UPI00141C7F5A|nr:hypothetical protein [Sporosalibacterium faouarense]MTI46367.1 hypothetical protein [Bacillota bacterium]